MPLATSEEALVTKPYLDERERITADLQRRVAELGEQIEYELKLREEHNRDQTHRMEKEYSESTRQSVAEYDKLTDDKNLMQASKFFA
ncbi:hypothetical protein Pmar_PMAR019604 [Perkinsus marinus ATCC 50983]|uniref:Uncharacterized protein n=1 Tax=Perkinsus marinus (strain ATCC 50983 / TXsc) TaxID=423536 RepID=C5LGK0_PERM5|nr:hypothetical protein Pmar_PMAR019604 [Perkinsus marinus ATCC 50983]EER04186.1 hypothetical protein Pmar_PMAR019604 [Perkinsus marinus ATCC 50983]|eukprot:XP_002772370.1 hypothetical protein Pmar_PMAR019604 [Perkinsus marinus ATCC 50983]